MKTLSLFATALIFTITTFAQDANYSGPGKMYVKAFWNQAELLKNGKGSSSTVGNMKRALDNAKEKDPALNAAAMEEELKKWQAEADKKLEAAKTPEQKEADAKSSGYNGPAKNQVGYFWQFAMQPADKLSESVLNHNIGEMEYALKATKEKDPAYDVSEMEATLKK